MELTSIKYDQDDGIDAATNSLQVLDYAHHEIHSGSHFLYTDHAEINEDGTQDYLITVPDSTKWPHMIFKMDGTLITKWQLYEGGDRVGTTPQTLGNSNRNSTKTATVTVHKGTSGGTTYGNQIHIYKSGTATNKAVQGGQTRNDDELILKQNTKYILRVTSYSDGNLTNLHLSWYEHTDKN